jgi:hypothetical protein
MTWRSELPKKSGVYVVSKINYAECWRGHRLNGLPIISSWIDDGGPEDIDFSEAWPRYLAEVSSAAVVLVYVSGDAVSPDRLKGGLLEIGAGLASGATVIVVGEIPELKTAKHHDRIIEVETLPEALRLTKELLEQNQEHKASEQEIVGDWALRCFGSRSFNSLPERARRVLEEAIELAQASGLSIEDGLNLMQYVYRRPIGELSQELAGVGSTLLVLAESQKIDLKAVISADIQRVLELPEEYFKERLARKVAAGMAISDTEGALA